MVAKAAAGLGLVVLFVVAVAIGLLAHLDTGGGRRVVAAVATRVLAGGVLPGHIEVDRIGHIGLDGLSGVRARIYDPEGVQVVFADGVGVEARVVPFLRTLVSSGKIDLDVVRVRLAHADVDLDVAKGGDLRLVRAFVKDEPAKESPPGKKTELDIRVAAVQVDHVWAHGTPPGGTLVDAELFRLAAKAHIDTSAVAVDLDQVGLLARSLPRGVDPRGRIAGRMVLPISDDAAPDALFADATFDGTIGAIPTRLAARMKGPHVEASVSARSETGAPLRALAFEGMSSEAALALQVDVKGDLPRLDARATASFAGRGRMESAATIVVGPVTRVDATTSIRHVDLSKILADAPPSDLGLDAFGHVESGEALRASARLATVAGTVGGEDVPPVFVRAELDGARGSGELRIGGDLTPTEVTVAVGEEDGRRVVDTDAHVELRDLARLPLAPAGLHGRADVRVTGRLVPDTGAVQAKAKVRGSDTGLGENGARDVRVDATLSGTLSRPRVALGGRVEGLRAGATTVQSADVRGSVELGREGGRTHVTVERPHVDLARDGVAFAVHADRVALAGSDVRVDGAVIDGLGEPIRARLAKVGERIQGELVASSIDLARVGVLAGEAKTVGGGTASVHAEVNLGSGASRGEVSLRVDDARLGGVRRTNLALDASVDGPRVRVDLRGNLADAARVAIRTTDLEIAGDAARASSWLGATGVVEVDSEADLEKTAAYVPEDLVRDLEARGLVSLVGRVARTDRDGVPDVRLHLKTRGLAYGPPGATTLNGVDLETDLLLDESSVRGGAEDAELAVRVLEPEGVLASASVKAALPVLAMLRAPASAQRLAFAAPIQVKVSVPRRDLATMPSALGLDGADGEVALDLDASGSLDRPQVTLVARGENLRAVGVTTQTPTQVEVRGVYADGRGDLGVALAQEGARIATFRGAVLADLGALAAGVKDVAWRASARLDLARFPLDAVDAVRSNRVHGRVTGSVELVDLHADANARAQLSFEGLKVGRSNYEVAKVAVAAGKGAGVVSARLQSGDEWLDVGATTGLSWGRALVPELEPSRPLDARVAARNFSLAVLQPFLAGAVHSLEGTLDGRAKMSFDGKDTKLEGKLAVSKGRVQVAALGEELRDVRATVTLSPDGTIAASDVFARSSSGEVKAEAKVVLNGLVPMAASGRLAIDKRDKFPVTLDGSPLGEVWGEVRLDAKRDSPKAPLVASIDVPSLGIDLAEKTKSTVRSLEEPVDVEVGRYGARRRFVELPLDRFDMDPVTASDGGSGERIVLDVKLRRVEVLRGNMLRIQLEGEPKIELGGAEPRVTGEIRVKSGGIDIQGKKFEVEQGTVEFTGNASNPTVTATAGWTAADGTRVFADFIGPVQTGKVTLRSEPGLPKNEILSLIVFGTADTAIGSPKANGSTTNTAATALGGVAAQGFTDALDDLTGVRAQARVDTTRSSNPRPEVEVQVSRTVSVAVSHVLGTPPISEPDKNLARVQWRFRKNWSLETTFGDRGRAMVDGIWQKRY